MDYKPEFTKDSARKLLKEYVEDKYQNHHAEMVALVLEGYAKKFGEDEDLWYITGLLHDLDFDKFPKEHVVKELGWFKKWEFPESFIHAVDAHGHMITGTKPETKLASCLVATDELCGFLYAYSLMRPTGFEGMKDSSAAKKFKDKSFAPNIDREDVRYGVEEFGVDFKEHLDFVIKALQSM